MLDVQMRWLLVLLAALLVGCFADAEVLVVETGTVGPEPTSVTKRFVHSIGDTGRRVGIAADIKLSGGTASVRAASADEEPLFSETFEPASKARGVVLPARTSAGELELVVELEEAVGSWEVTVVHVPPDSSFNIFAISGPLVLLVVALALWLARRRFRTKLRWLWAGAGLWAVAVVLKGTSDYLFTKPVLERIESAVPAWAYIPAGAGYVGLHSAVFEMGLTLLAAVLWRRLSRDSNRAVNVGVGAGVLEALLIGVVTIIAVVPLLRGEPLTVVGASYTTATTSAVWLVAATERALTIPVHVASRALLFHGVATGRTRSLLFGFLLFTGLDSVAGAIMVGQLHGRISMWWFELAILPFCVISVLAIRWLLRVWPLHLARSADGDEAMVPEERSR